MQTIHTTQSVDSESSFTAGYKITDAQHKMLQTILKEDPLCPSSRVLDKMTARNVPLAISVRHLNRLRHTWGLSCGKGRPVGARSSFLRPRSSESDAPVTSSIPCVGLRLFDDWLEQQEAFTGVVSGLQQGIEDYRSAHPSASFPVLRHTEQTLERRFKALFYAPLLGIRKITEFDVKEHALESLIGTGYQSSTLNQFLGQLERINAAESLMPVLVPNEPGKVGYIDGHMIALWTSVSMHKGKITMLGRIMAGSQAIVAHNEDGQALFVDYQPPDMHLLRVIVDYCRQLVRTTGIEVFVIDREVNAVSMASTFEHEGWGVLCMLNTNEYRDLSDWDTEVAGQLADGRTVYRGQWREPRAEDPRHFVIVESQERLLVYWGTSKVTETFDALEWPGLYAQRTEVQENSFKRMIAHGALNVNYGTKKIVGPDRHQQRAREALDEKLGAMQARREKKMARLQEQQAKVKESEEKGHGIRLRQRQQRQVLIENEVEALTRKAATLKTQDDALGPAKTRADRDFRKQRIMTFRTLLLENMLMAFFQTLNGLVPLNIGIETLVELFFKRSGTTRETDSEMVYRIHTEGLSRSYTRTLQKIVDAVNDMALSRHEKSIRVTLMPVPT